MDKFSVPGKWGTCAAPGREGGQVCSTWKKGDLYSTWKSGDSCKCLEEGGTCTVPESGGTSVQYLEEGDKHVVHGRGTCALCTYLKERKIVCST